MRISFALSLFVGIGILVNVGMWAAPEQSTSQMMEKKAAMQAAAVGDPQQSPLEELMCDEDGNAVGGMDLISYRQSGGPVHGSPEFSHKVMDNTYVFAGQENLDTFKADPQRYLPAYGGFCAMTLALGTVTCPDVMHFKIENHRLLLFEVTGFTNGKTLWETDPSGFRAKADQNFKRFSAH